jgi:hypothetical protein
VRDSKVRVEGKCEFAPNVLGIMDTINLSIRYICSLLFTSCSVLLKFLFMKFYGLWLILLDAK